MNVVSLFDGISGGRIALERAGYKVKSYDAFEIDPAAIAISKYHYPDIKQRGNVFGFDYTKLGNNDINLLIGGSPCTTFSIAKRSRETEKGGKGWELFTQYVKALKLLQPQFYLYENVASMSPQIKAHMSEELQCEPILINSSTLSAQHRQRFYWTNIKNVSQPDDNGIMVKDILEKGFVDCKPISLSNAVKKKIIETADRQPTMNYGTIRLTEIGKGGTAQRIYSANGKAVTIKSQGGGLGAIGGLYKVDLPNGYYVVRKLTPLEVERCQMLPDKYTEKGVDYNGETIYMSSYNRYRAIGNGFTIDIVAHILRHMEQKG